ncbi:hypothetical protein F53441_2714 [Fusarium austroafricanum]|uniref:Uncharacterized protein n=1 Tax=Fusarium austroafricanum TaxID=2364996 RepID=A0A8H4NXI9_9HYPO|nr:hypothetical protein F53441_2714 [Fusarium austroafricanum]
MAFFHAQDLQAHMKLFRSEDRSESHDVISTPIFTEHVGKYLVKSGKKKPVSKSESISQYGLLACDISVTGKLDEPVRLFHNVSAPSSVFICGSQGSGKSHTLATLLENCLVPSAASVLHRPLAGLVFHYDSIVSDAGGLPCEAAFLSSNKHVAVRVLCPPTNTATIKKVYASLPNVSVHELRFSQDNLNTKRMLNLMVASSGQNGKMPLYLHTVMPVLRELRIKQQQRGGGFDYKEFKGAMKDEPLTKEQSAPLQQRLDTLESFMVKQDTDAGGSGSRKGKEKSRLRSKGSIDWTPVLLDLCSITIVHRFTSPVWLHVLRRHLAGATDNSGVHERGELQTPDQNQQDMPATNQYRTIPEHELFTNIVQLRIGEAFLFAPSGIVNASSKNQAGSTAATNRNNWQPIFLGNGIMKVLIRNRITADGGKTIIAE